MLTKTKKRYLFSAILFLFLVASTAAGFFLLKNSQDNRQQASTGECSSDNPYCTCAYNGSGMECKLDPTLAPPPPVPPPGSESPSPLPASAAPTSSVTPIPTVTIVPPPGSGIISTTNVKPRGTTQGGCGGMWMNSFCYMPGDVLSGNKIVVAAYEGRYNYPYIEDKATYENPNFKNKGVSEIVGSTQSLGQECGGKGVAVGGTCYAFGATVNGYLVIPPGKTGCNNTPGNYCYAFLQKIEVKGGFTAWQTAVDAYKGGDLFALDKLYKETYGIDFNPGLLYDQSADNASVLRAQALLSALTNSEMLAEQAAAQNLKLSQQGKLSTEEKAIFDSNLKIIADSKGDAAGLDSFIDSNLRNLSMNSSFKQTYSALISAAGDADLSKLAAEQFKAIYGYDPGAKYSNLNSLLTALGIDSIQLNNARAEAARQAEATANAANSSSPEIERLNEEYRKYATGTSGDIAGLRQAIVAAGWTPAQEAGEMSDQNLLEIFLSMASGEDLAQVRETAASIVDARNKAQKEEQLISDYVNVVGTSNQDRVANQSYGYLSSLYALQTGKGPDLTLSVNFLEKEISKENAQFALSLYAATQDTGYLQAYYRNNSAPPIGSFSAPPSDEKTLLTAIYGRETANAVYHDVVLPTRFQDAVASFSLDGGDALRGVCKEIGLASCDINKGNAVDAVDEMVASLYAGKTDSNGNAFNLSEMTVDLSTQINLTSEATKNEKWWDLLAARFVEGSYSNLNARTAGTYDTTEGMANALKVVDQSNNAYQIAYDASQVFDEYETYSYAKEYQDEIDDYVFGLAYGNALMQDDRNDRNFTQEDLGLTGKQMFGLSYNQIISQLPLGLNVTNTTTDIATTYATAQRDDYTGPANTYVSNLAMIGAENLNLVEEYQPASRDFYIDKSKETAKDIIRSGITYAGSFLAATSQNAFSSEFSFANNDPVEAAKQASVAYQLEQEHEMLTELYDEYVDKETGKSIAFDSFETFMTDPEIKRSAEALHYETLEKVVAPSAGLVTLLAAPVFGVALPTTLGLLSSEFSLYQGAGMKAQALEMQRYDIETKKNALMLSYEEAGLNEYQLQEKQQELDLQINTLNKQGNMMLANSAVAAVTSVGGLLTSAGSTGSLISNTGFGLTKIGQVGGFGLNTVNAFNSGVSAATAYQAGNTAEGNTNLLMTATALSGMVGSTNNLLQSTSFLKNVGTASRAVDFVGDTTGLVSGSIVDINQVQAACGNSSGAFGDKDCANAVIGLALSLGQDVTQMTSSTKAVVGDVQLAKLTDLQKQADVVGAEILYLRSKGAGDEVETKYIADLGLQHGKLLADIKNIDAGARIYSPGSQDDYKLTANKVLEDLQAGYKTADAVANPEKLIQLGEQIKVVSEQVNGVIVERNIVEQIDAQIKNRGLAMTEAELTKLQDERSLALQKLTENSKGLEMLPSLKLQNDAVIKELGDNQTYKQYQDLAKIDEAKAKLVKENAPAAEAVEQYRSAQAGSETKLETEAAKRLLSVEALKSDVAELEAQKQALLKELGYGETAELERLYNESTDQDKTELENDLNKLKALDDQLVAKQGIVAEAKNNQPSLVQRIADIFNPTAKKTRQAYAKALELTAEVEQLKAKLRVTDADANPDEIAALNRRIAAANRELLDQQHVLTLAVAKANTSTKTASKGFFTIIADSAVGRFFGFGSPDSATLKKQLAGTKNDYEQLTKAQADLAKLEAEVAKIKSSADVNSAASKARLVEVTKLTNALSKQITKAQDKLLSTVLSGEVADKLKAMGDSPDADKLTETKKAILEEATLALQKKQSLSDEQTTQISELIALHQKLFSGTSVEDLPAARVAYNDALTKLKSDLLGAEPSREAYQKLSEVHKLLKTASLLDTVKSSADINSVLQTKEITLSVKDKTLALRLDNLIRETELRAGVADNRQFFSTRENQIDSFLKIINDPRVAVELTTSGGKTFVGAMVLKAQVEIFGHETGIFIAKPGQETKIIESLAASYGIKQSEIASLDYTKISDPSYREALLKSSYIVTDPANFKFLRDGSINFADGNFKNAAQIYRKLTSNVAGYMDELQINIDPNQQAIVSVGQSNGEIPDQYKTTDALIDAVLAETILAKGGWGLGDNPFLKLKTANDAATAKFTVKAQEQIFASLAGKTGISLDQYSYIKNNAAELNALSVNKTVLNDFLTKTGTNLDAERVIAALDQIDSINSFARFLALKLNDDYKIMVDPILAARDQDPITRPVIVPASNAAPSFGQSYNARTQSVAEYVRARITGEAVNFEGLTASPNLAFKSSMGDIFSDLDSKSAFSAVTGAKAEMAKLVTVAYGMVSYGSTEAVTKILGEADTLVGNRLSQDKSYQVRREDVFKQIGNMKADGTLAKSKGVDANGNLKIVFSDGYKEGDQAVADVHATGQFKAADQTYFAQQPDGSYAKFILGADGQPIKLDGSFSTNDIQDLFANGKPANTIIIMTKIGSTGDSIATRDVPGLTINNFKSPEGLIAQSGARIDRIAENIADQHALVIKNDAAPVGDDSNANKMTTDEFVAWRKNLIDVQAEFEKAKVTQGLNQGVGSATTKVLADLVRTSTDEGVQKWASEKLLKFYAEAQGRDLDLDGNDQETLAARKQQLTAEVTAWKELMSDAANTDILNKIKIADNNRSANDKLYKKMLANAAADPSKLDYAEGTSQDMTLSTTREAVVTAGDLESYIALHNKYVTRDSESEFVASSGKPPEAAQIAATTKNTDPSGGLAGDGVSTRGDLTGQDEKARLTQDADPAAAKSAKIELSSRVDLRIFGINLSAFWNGALDEEKLAPLVEQKKIDLLASYEAKLIGLEEALAKSNDEGQKGDYREQLAFVEQQKAELTSNAWYAVADDLKKLAEVDPKKLTQYRSGGLANSSLINGAAPTKWGHSVGVDQARKLVAWWQQLGSVRDSLKQTADPAITLNKIKVAIQPREAKYGSGKNQRVLELPYDQYLVGISVGDITEAPTESIMSPTTPALSVQMGSVENAIYSAVGGDTYDLYTEQLMEIFFTIRAGDETERKQAAAKFIELLRQNTSLSISLTEEQVIDDLLALTEENLRLEEVALKYGVAIPAPAGNLRSKGIQVIILTNVNPGMSDVDGEQKMTAEDMAMFTYRACMAAHLAGVDSITVPAVGTGFARGTAFGLSDEDSMAGFLEGVRQFAAYMQTSGATTNLKRIDYNLYSPEAVSQRDLDKAEKLLTDAKGLEILAETDAQQAVAALPATTDNDSKDDANKNNAVTDKQTAADVWERAKLLGRNTLGSLANVWKKVTNRDNYSTVITIGRRNDNSLQINPVLKAVVSRNHAQILRNEKGEFFIKDLEKDPGNTNETYVNDQKVNRSGTAPLADGDTVFLGELGRDGVAFQVKIENNNLILVDNSGIYAISSEKRLEESNKLIAVAEEAAKDFNKLDAKDMDDRIRDLNNAKTTLTAIGAISEEQEKAIDALSAKFKEELEALEKMVAELQTQFDVYNRSFGITDKIGFDDTQGQKWTKEVVADEQVRIKVLIAKNNYRNLGKLFAALGLPVPVITNDSEHQEQLAAFNKLLKKITDLESESELKFLTSDSGAADLYSANIRRVDENQSLEEFEKSARAEIEKISQSIVDVTDAAGTAPDRQNLDDQIESEDEESIDFFQLESIGRSATNTTSVPSNKQMSLKHAIFLKDTKGQYHIRDLGSTNGTYVNGLKIEAYVVKSVQVDDVIFFGDFKNQIGDELVGAQAKVTKDANGNLSLSFINDKVVVRSGQIPSEKLEVDPLRDLRFQAQQLNQKESRRITEFTSRQEIQSFIDAHLQMFNQIDELLSKLGIYDSISQTDNMYVYEDKLKQISRVVDEIKSIDNKLSEGNKYIKKVNLSGQPLQLELNSKYASFLAYKKANSSVQVAQNDRSAQTQSEIQQILNRLRVESSADMPQDKEMYLDSLKKVTEVLKDEPGVVVLEEDKPVIAVSDLHAKADLLADLFAMKVQTALGEMTLLEALSRNLVKLVLLGDGMHSEVKDNWIHINFADIPNDPDANKEMARSLSLMKAVMDLKVLMPSSFYYLKGNHDSLFVPFRKFIKQASGNPGEAEVVLAWMKSNFGRDFIDAWDRFEQEMPLMALQKNSDGSIRVFTHSAPNLQLNANLYGQDYYFDNLSLTDINNKTEKAYWLLTWTDNQDSTNQFYASESEIRQTAETLFGKQKKTLGFDWKKVKWFIGHRHTKGDSLQQLDGSLVQINLRGRLPVAVIAPQMDSQVIVTDIANMSFSSSTSVGSVGLNNAGNTNAALGRLSYLAKDYISRAIIFGSSNEPTLYSSKFNPTHAYLSYKEPILNPLFSLFNIQLRGSWIIRNYNNSTLRINGQWQSNGVLKINDQIDFGTGLLLRVVKADDEEIQLEKVIPSQTCSDCQEVKAAVQDGVAEADRLFAESEKLSQEAALAQANNEQNRAKDFSNQAAAKKQAALAKLSETRNKVINDHGRQNVCVQRYIKVLVDTKEALIRQTLVDTNAALNSVAAANKEITKTLNAGEMKIETTNFLGLVINEGVVALSPVDIADLQAMQAEIAKNGAQLEALKEQLLTAGSKTDLFGAIRVGAREAYHALKTLEKSADHTKPAVIRVSKNNFFSSMRNLLNGLKADGALGSMALAELNLNLDMLNSAIEHMRDNKLDQNNLLSDLTNLARTLQDRNAYLLRLRAELEDAAAIYLINIGESYVLPDTQNMRAAQLLVQIDKLRKLTDSRQSEKFAKVRQQLKAAGQEVPEIADFVTYNQRVAELQAKVGEIEQVQKLTTSKYITAADFSNLNNPYIVFNNGTPFFRNVTSFSNWQSFVNRTNEEVKENRGLLARNRKTAIFLGATSTEQATWAEDSIDSLDKLEKWLEEHQTAKSSAAATTAPTTAPTAAVVTTVPATTAPVVPVTTTPTTTPAKAESWFSRAWQATKKNAAPAAAGAAAAGTGLAFATRKLLAKLAERRAVRAAAQAAKKAAAGTPEAPAVKVKLSLRLKERAKQIRDFLKTNKTANRIFKVIGAAAIVITILVLFYNLIKPASPVPPVKETPAAGEVVETPIESAVPAETAAAPVAPAVQPAVEVPAVVETAVAEAPVVMSSQYFDPTFVPATANEQALVLIADILNDWQDSGAAGKGVLPSVVLQEGLAASPFAALLNDDVFKQGMVYADEQYVAYLQNYPSQEVQCVTFVDLFVKMGFGNPNYVPINITGAKNGVAEAKNFISSELASSLDGHYYNGEYDEYVVHSLSVFETGDIGIVYNKGSENPGHIFGVLNVVKNAEGTVTSITTMDANYGFEDGKVIPDGMIRIRTFSGPTASADFQKVYGKFSKDGKQAQVAMIRGTARTNDNQKSTNQRQIQTQLEFSSSVFDQSSDSQEAPVVPVEPVATEISLDDAATGAYIDGSKYEAEGEATITVMDKQYLHTSAGGGTICGPLSYALMRDGGYIGDVDSNGKEIVPNDFNQMNDFNNGNDNDNLPDLQRIFPEDKYQWTTVTDSIANFDSKAHPVKVGDLLYLKGGDPHWITITKIDAQGRIYATTNIQKGYLEGEDPKDETWTITKDVLMHDPATGEGQFAKWARGSGNLHQVGGKGYRQFSKIDDAVSIAAPPALPVAEAIQEVDQSIAFTVEVSAAQDQALSSGQVPKVLTYNLSSGENVSFNFVDYEGSFSSANVSDVDKIIKGYSWLTDRLPKNIRFVKVSSSSKPYTIADHGDYLQINIAAATEQEESMIIAQALVDATFYNAPNSTGQNDVQTAFYNLFYLGKAGTPGSYFQSDPNQDFAENSARKNNDENQIKGSNAEFALSFAQFLNQPETFAKDFPYRANFFKLLSQGVEPTSIVYVTSDGVLPAESPMIVKIKDSLGLENMTFDQLPADIQAINLEYRGAAEAAAIETGVPVVVLVGVMQWETGDYGDSRATWVSDAGTIGLMQITPGDGPHALPGRPNSAELKDPYFNVLTGARILKSIYDDPVLGNHNWKDTLALYNVGSFKNLFSDNVSSQGGFVYADNILGSIGAYQGALENSTLKPITLNVKNPFGGFTSAQDNGDGTYNFNGNDDRWKGVDQSIIPSYAKIFSRENYLKITSFFNVTNGLRYLGLDTYCNIFVSDVTKAMGAEIPHWLNNKEQSATDMLAWLKSQFAFDLGWHPVSAEQAKILADQGKPTIAVTEGHISMVVPGDGFTDENGVFWPSSAQAGRINFGPNEGKTVFQGFEGAIAADQEILYFAFEGEQYELVSPDSAQNNSPLFMGLGAVLPNWLAPFMPNIFINYSIISDNVGIWLNNIHLLPDFLFQPVWNFVESISNSLNRSSRALQEKTLINDIHSACQQQKKCQEVFAASFTKQADEGGQQPIAKSSKQQTAAMYLHLKNQAADNSKDLTDEELQKILQLTTKTTELKIDWELTASPFRVRWQTAVIRGPIQFLEWTQKIAKGGQEKVTSFILGKQINDIIRSSMKELRGENAKDYLNKILSTPGMSTKEKMEYLAQILNQPFLYRELALNKIIESERGTLTAESHPLQILKVAGEGELSIELPSGQTASYRDMVWNHQILASALNHVTSPWRRYSKLNLDAIQNQGKESDINAVTFDETRVAKSLLNLGVGEEGSIDNNRSTLKEIVKSAYLETLSYSYQEWQLSTQDTVDSASLVNKLLFENKVTRLFSSYNRSADEKSFLLPRNGYRVVKPDYQMEMAFMDGKIILSQKDIDQLSAADKAKFDLLPVLIIDLQKDVVSDDLGTSTVEAANLARRQFPNANFVTLVQTDGKEIAYSTSTNHEVWDGGQTEAFMAKFVGRVYEDVVSRKELKVQLDTTAQAPPKFGISPNAEALKAKADFHEIELNVSAPKLFKAVNEVANFARSLSEEQLPKSSRLRSPALILQLTLLGPNRKTLDLSDDEISGILLGNNAIDDDLDLARFSNGLDLLSWQQASTERKVLLLQIMEQQITLAAAQSNIKSLVAGIVATLPSSWHAPLNRFSQFFASGLTNLQAPAMMSGFGLKKFNVAGQPLDAKNQPTTAAVESLLTEQLATGHRFAGPALTPTQKSAMTIASAHYVLDDAGYLKDVVLSIRFKNADNMVALHTAQSMQKWIESFGGGERDEERKVENQNNESQEMNHVKKAVSLINEATTLDELKKLKEELIFNYEWEHDATIGIVEAIFNHRAYQLTDNYEYLSNVDGHIISLGYFLESDLENGFSPNVGQFDQFSNLPAELIEMLSLISTANSENISLFSEQLKSLVKDFRNNYILPASRNYVATKKNESNQLHLLAERIYNEKILPIIKSEQRISSLKPEDQIFAKAEILDEIAAESRQEIIRFMAEVIREQPDFFEQTENINWIKNYFRNAQIVHNYRSVDQSLENSGFGRVKELFGASTDLSHLSVTIGDPTSTKFKLVGSGFIPGGEQKELAYVFDLEEFGGQAAAVNGDIGDLASYGISEDAIIGHRLTIQDAVFAQAIYDSFWTKRYSSTGEIKEHGVFAEYPYAELVLLLSQERIDFSQMQPHGLSYLSNDSSISLKKSMAETQAFIADFIIRNPDFEIDDLKTQFLELARKNNLEQSSIDKLTLLIDKYGQKIVKAKEIVVPNADPYKLFEETFDIKPIGSVKVQRVGSKIVFETNALNIARVSADYEIKTPKKGIVSIITYWLTVVSYLPRQAFAANYTENFPFVTNQVIVVGTMNGEQFKHERQHSWNGLLKEVKLFGGFYDGKMNKKFNDFISTQTSNDDEANQLFNDFLSNSRIDADNSLADELIAVVAGRLGSNNKIGFWRKAEIFMDLQLISPFAEARQDMRSYRFNFQNKKYLRSYLIAVEKYFGRFVQSGLIIHALDAYNLLVGKGYSREEIFAIIQPERMSDWTMVAEMMPDNIANAKEAPPQ